MNPLKYWNSETFEISSYKWHLSERVNKTYNYSGSDTTGKCVYTYNELGFRGDSIKKEGFKVMSIGCSNTEGIGVNDYETWPAQFTKLLSNGVNMNFGTGGRSNDFISRCLLSYYDIIKPDLVLIMYTIPHRREVFTTNGGIEPYIPTVSWGYLKDTEEGSNIQNLKIQLQNYNEDYVNWYKNHLLIKYFLDSKKCNWVWNGSFIENDYNEFNRFDGEYIKFIDKGVDNIHPGPKTNYNYANNLFNYILTKFPSFLPNVEKIKSKFI
jgi:hypothetical protein